MTDTRRLSAAALMVVTACGVAFAQAGFHELLADLQSSREATRVKAVRALSTSGYPDVSSALLPLLADPANTVQLEVIDALLGIALAPAPARDLAVPLKREHGSIAWSVFEAGPLAVLPRAWPGQLTNQLGSALRDDDWRVRVAAAGALAVLASPWSGALPSDAQGQLAADLTATLASRDAATREAAARAAGTIFAGATDPPLRTALANALIEALNDSESTVRVAATEALGWLADERAAHALRERYTFYGRGPEAEAALHALTRLAKPADARIFREALSSRDVAQRVIGAEGLARLRDPTAVSILTARMQAERENSVLLAITFAFRQLGGHENLERLVTALTRPGLARQARAYLTELGAEVAPELEAFLRNDDPPIRRVAVEVLGLSGHPASEAALQPVARSDSDPAVAEAARQAVIRLRALPGGVRTR
jgi:HEAT repeat protein